MDDKIEIMFNSCHGGFGFSDAAMNAYRQTKELEDAEPVSRHDPLMVQIVKDMGFEANGRHSFICIRSIPAKFENYYEIIEYDGMESVHIRYSEYKVDAAKVILKDAQLSEAERVERASAILEMEYIERADTILELSPEKYALTVAKYAACSQDGL